MLDWKNRAGSAPERAAEPKSATRSYVSGLLFSRALATLIGLYLLVTIGLPHFIRFKNNSLSQPNCKHWLSTGLILFPAQEISLFP